MEENTVNTSIEEETKEEVKTYTYPSSTTMLVMCVMPTAIMQFNSRKI